MHESKRELFCCPEEERALLSFSIKDIDLFYDIQSKMDDNDFLDSEHKLLFVLLKDLSKRGAEKFDLSLILSSAKDASVLDHIGGIDYVNSIASMPVHKKNYHVYLKTVLEASTKFKLCNILQEDLTDLVDKPKSSVESVELIGRLESKILDLSTGSRSISEPRDFAEGLTEYLEECRVNSVDILGLSTGFPILDRQIDGLVPGTLFVIAARKKVGKSAFLTNVASRMAYNMQIPILYIDTEMTFEEWRPRVIAGLSNVEERAIKHGSYSKEQHSDIIERCVQRVQTGKLFHEYMPGYSVDKLVALYKKYKAKHNIGLMVFDYLKEPDSSSLDRQRAEYQILGDVTTKLKDLAGQLDIPAVTAVQLNRNGDIADSDRIARYGDVIAFWSALDDKDREEDGGGTVYGSHKLVIKDTRRGGATGEQGIRYFFFKKQLLIKEVKADLQPVTYSESDIVNTDTVELEDYKDAVFESNDELS